MMKKIIHISKIVFILVVFSLFIFQPATVNAQAVSGSFDLNIDCDDGVLDFSCAIMEVILWVVLVFGKMWAFFLELTVKGTVFLIQFGQTIIESQPVKSGFGASLRFTNLIFLIAIIIIAFSTILRFEAYSIKKMLPKLIIAALLVNFSLLIAGLILDTGNVFTSYFLGRGVTGEGIGQAFNPQEFLAPGGKADLGDGSWAKFGKVLLGVIIAIIMTILMTLAMLWVMLLVLVRNMWIAFLLILMPLIWGFWVMPFFQQHWSDWWKNFIKWAISLPTVTFFLWLAVQVAITPAFKNSFVNEDLVLSEAQEITNSITTPDIFTLCIRMLVIIGLIIGGLRAGKAFSAIGTGLLLGGAGFLAKATMGGIGKTLTAPLWTTTGLAGAINGTKQGGGLKGALKGAGAWGGKFFGIGATTKTTTKALAGGGAALANRFSNQTTTDEYGNTEIVLDQDRNRGQKALGGVGRLLKGATAGNLYGRASQWLSEGAAGLSFLPGMGKMAQVFGKMATAPRAAVEAAMKETEGLAPTAMRAWIKAAASRGPAYMAAAAMLAEKNHMNDAMHGSEKSYADAVASFFPGTKREDISTLSGMAAHDPRHAQDVTNQSMKTVVQKATAGDIQSWTKEVFNAVKGFMSSSQIKAWASRDAESHSEALTHSMHELSGVLEHMKDGATKTAMAADFAAMQGGSRDRELMRRMSGHIETIGGDKELMSKLNSELKSDLEFAREIKRVTVRTKTSTAHPPATYGDYGLGALLGGLLRSAVKTAGASIPKASSGGSSHGGGGGGGHSSGGH